MSTEHINSAGYKDKYALVIIYYKGAGCNSKQITDFKSKAKMALTFMTKMMYRRHDFTFIEKKHIMNKYIT